MKISVPVNIGMKHLPFDEQKILRELKKLDAECIVFTVLDISDEDFVCSEIKKHGASLQDVFLMTVDDCGKVTLVKRDHKGRKYGGYLVDIL